MSKRITGILMTVALEDGGTGMCRAIIRSGTDLATIERIAQSEMLMEDARTLIGNKDAELEKLRNGFPV